MVHPEKASGCGQNGNQRRFRDETKSCLCTPCMGLNGVLWPLLRRQTPARMDVQNVMHQLQRIEALTMATKDLRDDALSFELPSL